MHRKIRTAGAFAVLGLVSSAAVSIATAAPALAQEARRQFNIPAQPLASALIEYSRQSGLVVSAPSRLTRGKAAPAVEGFLTNERALQLLLQGTGLRGHRGRNGGFVVDANPQTAAAETPLRRSPETGSDAAPPTTGESGSSSEEDSGLHEIVVTGTNIRGRSPAGSPLTTFTRSEIERSGAATIDQFLRVIPQNFNGGRNGTSEIASQSFENADNNARITTVNLRGLAAGTTLSLVNSARMAPVGRYGDFDISAIPSLAIEQLTILGDGASAVYGSDAVAGVVNFILRKNLDGAETTGRISNADRSDFREIVLSQAAGRVWSTGSAAVYYEYVDRNELKGTERSFANSPISLIDPETRHNVYGNINNDLSDSSSVNLDVLYSHRAGRTRETFYGPSNFRAYAIEYLTITPTAFVTLFEGAELTLQGGFGSTTETFVVESDAGDIHGGSKNDYGSLKAQLSGNLFSLPAGKIKYSIGTDYRHEELRLIQLSGADRLSRSVTAGFIELSLPLLGQNFAPLQIQSAHLSAAIRHESFSDTHSSTNPKIGLDIEPISGLKFRASWSTSFRAPNLYLAETENFGVLIDLPHPVTGANTLQMIYGGAVKNLKPERAANFTLGADWNGILLDGLSMHATYYNIHYRDRIASAATSNDTFLRDPATYAEFLNFSPSQQQIDAIVGSIPSVKFVNLYGPFSAVDAPVIMDFRITNVAQTRADGIDIQLDYRREIERGAWGASLNASKAFHFTNTPLAGGPSSNDLDRLYRPLDLRIRAGGYWEQGGVSLSSYVNYADQYKNRDVVPSERVRSYITVDLGVRYEFPAGGGLLSGFSASLQGRNIFNSEPPLVSNDSLGRGVFYDGANADPYQRQVSLTLHKRW